MIDAGTREASFSQGRHARGPTPPLLLALAIEAEWRKLAAGRVPAQPRARPAGQRQDPVFEELHRSPVNGWVWGTDFPLSRGSPERRRVEMRNYPKMEVETPGPRIPRSKSFNRSAVRVKMSATSPGPTKSNNTFLPFRADNILNRSKLSNHRR